MSIFTKAWAAVSHVFRHGEPAQGEDCFTFVAYPARVSLRRKYLLNTPYGDWLRKGPFRVIAIIVGCTVVFQMLQQSMPWEGLLFTENRVDEHDTPDGLVTYTIRTRPTVAKIFHVFVQAWLAFSLVHFPNKDLFLRQIVAFDTLMIVCPALVVFAMWIVMEESKHPPTLGERIYYMASQIVKIPTLLVVASQDSLRMNRWVKILLTLCIAWMAAYERIAVHLGLFEVPQMEDCKYGLKCKTAVDFYLSGLTTAGLFCCKAAFCYYRRYPFAAVRPRYVIGDEEGSWDMMNSANVGNPFGFRRSARRAPSPMNRLVGPDISVGSASKSVASSFGAIASPSTKSVAESIQLRGTMAAKGSSIRAAVTSAATSATLAALASSTLGVQAQLKLGQEDGLRKLVASVVTSVQTAVEADLAASSGGPIASYQDWDLDSVIGIAARAAAEGARLHRDALAPGQDHHPAEDASEEVKCLGQEEMERLRLVCAAPDAYKGPEAPLGAEAELGEMKAAQETEGMQAALEDHPQPRGIDSDLPVDGNVAEMKTLVLDFANADAMGRGVSEPVAQAKPQDLLAEVQVLRQAAHDAEAELERMKKALEDATDGMKNALKKALEKMQESEGMQKALEDATTALKEAQVQRNALHGQLAAINASKYLIQRQLGEMKEERNSIERSKRLLNPPYTSSTPPSRTDG